MMAAGPRATHHPARFAVTFAAMTDRARPAQSRRMRSLSARLCRHQLVRQISGFMAVGAVTTTLHLALFAWWRPTLGGVIANALALTIATVVNTSLNGRITFDADRSTWLQAQLRAGSVFAAGLVVSTSAIWSLGWIWPTAPTWFAAGVVFGSSGIVTVTRFAAMRRWVFEPRPDTPLPAVAVR